MKVRYNKAIDRLVVVLADSCDPYPTDDESLYWDEYDKQWWTMANDVVDIVLVLALDMVNKGEYLHCCEEHKHFA